MATKERRRFTEINEQPLLVAIDGTELSLRHARALLARRRRERRLGWGLTEVAVVDANGHMSLGEARRLRNRLKKFKAD